MGGLNELNILWKYELEEPGLKVFSLELDQSDGGRLVPMAAENDVDDPLKDAEHARKPGFLPCAMDKEIKFVPNGSRHHCKKQLYSLQFQ